MQVTVDFSQANSMSEMAASGEVRLANGWEVNLDEKNIELLKQEASEKFASGAERLIEMQRLGMTPAAERAMRAYRAKDGEGLSGKAMDMLETLYEMPGSTLSAFGQTLMEFALIIAVAGLAFFFTKGPAVATLVMGMGAWVVSRRRRTFETLALWLKRRHRGRYIPPGLRSRRSPNRRPQSLMRKRRLRLFPVSKN